MAKKTDIESKEEIGNKISNVLDSIKDLDTQEIEDRVDSNKHLSSYSTLLTNLSSDPKTAIGTIIGHWKIKSLIGIGGMSIVYLVERTDEQLNQQAALKLIPNE